MSAAEFEVWDVTEWEIHSDETEGQEEKWWLIDPSTSEIWLFKPPVIKNGVRQGEDWAERVSTELADLIRVPCARVQLGVRDGRRGSMSRDLKPPGWELQSGQLLLAATDPSYQTKRKRRAFRARPGGRTSDARRPRGGGIGHVRAGGRRILAGQSA